MKLNKNDITIHKKISIYRANAVQLRIASIEFVIFPSYIRAAKSIRKWPEVSNNNRKLYTLRLSSTLWLSAQLHPVQSHPSSLSLSFSLSSYTRTLIPSHIAYQNFIPERKIHSSLNVFAVRSKLIAHALLYIGIESHRREMYDGTQFLAKARLSFE